MCLPSCGSDGVEAVGAEDDGHCECCDGGVEGLEIWLVGFDRFIGLRRCLKGKWIACEIGMGLGNIKGVKSLCCVDG